MIGPMRRHHLFLFSLGAIGLSTSALVVASCGSNGNGSTSHGTGGAHQGTGGAGGSGASAPSCTTSADCNGGVCVNGVCCPSQADVCGEQCCTGGTVCLFDKCV